MARSPIPLDLTSFIGRSAELEQLSRLASQSRLLTLTGGPGAGKTRLALELARERFSASEEVGWVELAPLRDPGLMLPAVADALDLAEGVRAGDVDALCRLLGDRECLLVLDNCEHLVDDVAGLAHTLLTRCPGLSIIATSREALGVRGERAWLVPPLGLPGTEATDPADSEAVRLFVDRAREVAPGFELSAGTATEVSEICRRLEGIPLAIELAAARVKILRPAEILARLDDVFRILTDDRRTTAARHRTLRAAMDWSHDLLREPARVLFRRLAVFRGGFTLEAAEAVGPGGSIQPEEVLELVGRLVDRSLLVVREGQGFTRYRLLEPVRQYAADKLAVSGEEDDVRAWHARYALSLVERAEPHLTGRDRRVWTARLHAEIDNLRSALGWTRAHDPELHVRMVGRLWWFWFSTQHWTEGGRWIDGALALDDEPGSRGERAALLFAAGALAALQVRTETARTALEEAAALASAEGDPRLEAYALNYLGMTYAGEGDPRAVELCRRAETWFRADDDLYGLRLALLLQGSAALGRGALDDAERLNREGLEIARRFGEPREIAISLQNLAVALIVQGRLDEAETLVLEALRTSRQDLSYYFIATGVGYLGEIEGRRSRPLEAARLLGAAEALRERVGARPFPLDARRLVDLMPRLRSLTSPGELDDAWAEGRALSPEQLLDELAGPSSTPPLEAGVRAVDGARPQEVAGPASDPPAGTATAPLEVDALGGFHVRVDGADVDGDRWPYAKPRELLVYLLLHPGGRTREQVGEALWPEATPSNAKNSFHVTLHHLRKVLGHPEWIGVEGDRYRLRPDLPRRFDVVEFQEAADRARAEGTVPALRSAIDRYRGGLLEGESVGRWLEEHRDRLGRIHVALNLELAEALEETDPEEASDIYRSLAAREELDEEIHRRLMTSLARAGDRVGALRHYDRLVDLLDQVLQASPETETRQLYDRLRAGEAVE